MPPERMRWSERINNPMLYRVVETYKEGAVKAISDAFAGGGGDPDGLWHSIVVCLFISLLQAHPEIAV